MCETTRTNGSRINEQRKEQEDKSGKGNHRAQDRVGRRCDEQSDEDEERHHGPRLVLRAEEDLRRFFRVKSRRQRYAIRGVSR